MMLTTEAGELLQSEDGLVLTTEAFVGVIADLSSITDMLFELQSEVQVIPARIPPPPGLQSMVTTRASIQELPFTLDRFGRPT